MAGTQFKAEIPEQAKIQVADKEAQDLDSLSKEQMTELYLQQAELNKQLQATLVNLKETIEYLTRKLYGRSSEKTPIVGLMTRSGSV